MTQRRENPAERLTGRGVPADSRSGEAPNPGYGQ